jgi:hypothetical protein
MKINVAADFADRRKINKGVKKIGRMKQFVVSHLHNQ